MMYVMKIGIVAAVFLFICSSSASAQSLHVNDIVALNKVPRAATDSFLKSKKFSVCESDQTGSVEGHEYSKYSPNCREPFQEYVTDNYHSGHHITYAFYDNNFYKQIVAELQQEGFRVMRKHDVAGCKVIDYKKDDRNQFQLRTCKQEEGMKYYLSVTAANKK